MSLGLAAAGAARGFGMGIRVGGTRGLTSTAFRLRFDGNFNLLILSFAVVNILIN